MLKTTCLEVPAAAMEGVATAGTATMDAGAAGLAAGAFAVEPEMRLGLLLVAITLQTALLARFEL
ncbi:MAG: hypothetical protein H7147_02775 [Frankiaceae bacterium]|nr:hypothetical protein [Arenimonas sp.]